ncbi:uncharacterized protein LOC143461956 [Clavelina lepadiformis]|uniref:uncharacterized protein LOC143461956 n=1 Tax=Clavelina lepadiformis TaxID=159417 RepID=UPI004040F5B9
MNVSLENSALGEVSETAQTASDIQGQVSNLPGMTKETNETTTTEQSEDKPQTSAVQGEPSIAVTGQPKATGGGISLDKTVEQTEKTANCCSSIFGCAGEATEVAGNIQELAEKE